MRKEHKILTGVAIGVSILVFGGLLTWGTSQSSTDATQNVSLEGLHVKQEAMAEDIIEIKGELTKQDAKLDTILIEVVKRNGGD